MHFIAKSHLAKGPSTYLKEQTNYLIAPSQDENFRTAACHFLENFSQLTGHFGLWKDWQTVFSTLFVWLRIACIPGQDHDKDLVQIHVPVSATRGLWLCVYDVELDQNEMKAKGGAEH